MHVATRIAAVALAAFAVSPRPAAGGVIAKGGGTYDARGSAGMPASVQDPPGRAAAGSPAARESAPAAAAQILYHGGPVMTNAAGVAVYLIWYGDWSGNTATTLVPEFLNHLGGSAYYDINTTYHDKAGAYVKNLVQLAGQVGDSYSQGASLSDGKVKKVVQHAITSGALPKDANAVYVVLTSRDVDETSGFCSAYCGWHASATVSRVDIKYAFVGDAARCITACAAQSVSPNDNPGADGMLSILAHELEEAVTDPDPQSGWAFADGNENADQCAWTFGTPYTVSNGAKANMKLNGVDYLIQQNWIQSSAGRCALHL